MRGGGVLEEGKDRGPEGKGAGGRGRAFQVEVASVCGRVGVACR